MPIFKDFAENGELLQIRQEPLNNVNLNRYIRVHGIESAFGYIDALSHTTETLDNILWVQFNNGSYPNPQAQIKYDVVKVNDKNTAFIEFMKNRTNSGVEQNKDSIYSIGQSVNEANLDEYTRQYGGQRLRGYIDALSDITIALGNIIYQKNLEDVLRTAREIKHDTQRLLEERSKFLEVARRKLLNL
ncbi:MAG TPA: hypothetical protein PLU58_00580 [Saprospiraceae bacterium]|nr:hypothetical protein [Saprospiraceae bacterium]